MLMEMELGSNELEVDFIRMILNVWVTECVKKKDEPLQIVLPD